MTALLFLRAYFEYQYFVPTYRRALQERFRDVRLHALWRNLPPPT